VKSLLKAKLATPKTVGSKKPQATTPASNAAPKPITAPKAKVSPQAKPSPKAKSSPANPASPPPQQEQSSPQGGLDEARLLAAILKQVPFDGWSRQALLSGAAAIGLHEGHIALAYPHGVRDAVAAFSQWANAAMMAQLANEKLFTRMRTRDKVAYAVRVRLELLAPHREAVQRLYAWALLPHHAPEAIKNLAQLCDTVWRSAGDTSTDFNYYTKRGLLGGVIQATTLFWLNDDSDNHEAAWAFLDRRIDEVLLVGKTIGQVRELPQHFGKLGSIAEIFDLASFLQLHHIGNNLGDSAVMLWRNFLVYIHRLIKRAGKRRVSYQRHT
jgi:ubiquinone biosynthesis protein COQ9